MKKLSVITAALGLAVFIFDQLAMLQHWTFFYGKETAEILEGHGAQVTPNLLVGLPAIAFILMASAAFIGYVAYKNLVFVVSGVTFLIILIAYLFKIMHWPGAGILLVLSFGAFIIVVIPWFAAFLMKKQDVEPEVNSGEEE